MNRIYHVVGEVLDSSDIHIGNYYYNIISEDINYAKKKALKIAEDRLTLCLMKSISNDMKIYPIEPHTVRYVGTKNHNTLKVLEDCGYKIYR